MPPTQDDPTNKDGDKGNLPDPVMDVLKDLQDKVSKLPKADERPADEEPKPATVPSYADKRAALQKRLGFNDDQMAAHEESQIRMQAPMIEQSGWAHLEKRQDLDKYRKEIESELKLAGYPQERRTPEIMEKIYFMVKGRHADAAPSTSASTEPKPKPGVASTRVSGGPAYSGTEGGASTEKEPKDKSEELSEQESVTAKKLGVDEKRFALSRNSGRDITPLRKADSQAPATGADLELRRLQGSRR